MSTYQGRFASACLMNQMGLRMTHYAHFSFITHAKQLLLVKLASLSSGLLGFWKPCGFKIEYMYLGFASAAAVPLGSEGDPGCIFFTHDTYQATFISDILLYYCRNLSYFPDTRTADGRTERGGGRTDRRGSRNSYLDRGNK